VGRFIGFDIDAEYVAVARQAVETGSTAPVGDTLRKHAATPRERKRAARATQPSLFESTADDSAL
jgi:hypothetical protein